MKYVFLVFTFSTIANISFNLAGPPPPFVHLFSKKMHFVTLYSGEFQCCFVPTLFSAGNVLSDDSIDNQPVKNLERLSNRCGSE